MVEQKRHFSTHLDAARHKIHIFNMQTDVDPIKARALLLREGASLLTHGLLTPFAYLKSKHRPKRQAKQRTLVFVHGLKGSRAQFYPLQGYLRLKKYTQILSYNHSSGPSIEALALQLKNLINNQVKGGHIDIIAHSMGGLIARFYLQNLDGERRVQRLITLGTPHQGTWASRMIPNARLAQMSPDGPFLETLNQKPLLKTLVFSAAAANDSLIVPAVNALYAITSHHLDVDTSLHKRHRIFADLGHTSLLLSPAVFQFIEQALQTPFRPSLHLKIQTPKST